MALKDNVQALKNAGYVSFSFDKAGGPNVTSNPLPNHSRPWINAILENLMEERKGSIRDVITPMEVIYDELVQARFLQFRKGETVREENLDKGYCQYHAKAQGHVIQKYPEFRNIVQNLMDKKDIEFIESIDLSINVITSTTYSKTLSSTGLMPITIFHDNETARDKLPKVSIPVLIVEVLRPFPYES